MKRIFAVVLCGAFPCMGALAGDVGVSLQFSQPGLFGRIDVGQYPQPQVIAPEPVMVERAPPALSAPEPVYLWVPHEHRQHWERHCQEYHACGRPVYFVDHDWYKKNVLARESRTEVRRDDVRYGEHGRADEENGHHKGHDEEDQARGRD